MATGTFTYNALRAKTLKERIKTQRKIVSHSNSTRAMLLGPDYMANFSPANRAEIPARLLKQILLKSNCRLHGEGFSPG